MEAWLVLFAVGICAAVPVPVNKGSLAPGAVLENPEIVPGLFEGDIELLPGENPLHRNAVGDKGKVWPNGIIPYEISSRFSSAIKKVFHQALAEIEHDTKVNGKTCVHFRPRNGDRAYLHYGGGDGCHTHVGYTGAEKLVTIGDGCTSKGTIMHETLHALGFYHEQSRSDRDQYITVHFDNVKAGDVKQFDKYQAPFIDLLGQPYDYHSIMHYGKFYFCKDKSKPTITPNKAGVTIGQRNGLSHIDIKEIQILYGCIPRPHPGGHVTHAPATSQPSSHGSGDYCSFSSGMCDWVQGRSSQTQWRRHSGSTPSTHTGPTGDHHSSSSASYIYLEASGHTNQLAKLNSKLYHGGAYCVDFYYNMYGSDMGTLNVNVVNGGQTTKLKTVSGDKGTAWHHYKVNANVHDSGTFKFQFEGHIGAGSKSDMAIDDITISHGAC